MVVTRYYELHKNLTENDFNWCIGLGIPLEIVEPETIEQSLGFGKGIRVVTAEGYFKLRTVNEKQTTALLLKFGNDLILTDIIEWSQNGTANLNTQTLTWPA